MPKTYAFPRRLLRRVHRAAVRADIEEVCYVVLGRGSRIEELVRVPNRASDRILCHEIWNKDVERAAARAYVLHRCVLGRLHTHPVSRARPSRTDISGYGPGDLLFIYSDLEREIGAFRIRPSGRGFVEKTVLVVS